MRAIPIALAALVLASPLGMALNPLDNDAGTGADASDNLTSGLVRPSLPLAVLEPGEYEGRLVAGIDLRDAYQWQANAGDRVRFTFEAEGPAILRVLGPHQGVHLEIGPGSSGVVAAPLGGNFTINVVLPLEKLFEPDPSIVVAYAFAFSSTTEGSAWSTDAGWLEVEATWASPSDVRLLAVFEEESVEPSASWITLDFFEREEDGYAYVSGVGSVGIRVGNSSLISGMAGRKLVRSAITEAIVPADVSVGGTGADLVDFVGGVRILAWGTAEASLATILMLGDAPTEVRVSRGPAASIATIDAHEDSLQLDPFDASAHEASFAVDGTVYAVLDFGQGGTLTRPSGAQISVPAEFPIVSLIAPENGAWHMSAMPDPPTLGEWDRLLLALAPIPTAGLLPPPPAIVV